MVWPADTATIIAKQALLADVLATQDHTCAQFDGPPLYIYSWCQQLDVCGGAAGVASRNEPARARGFARALRTVGHRCVRIWPCRDECDAVLWCGNIEGCTARSVLARSVLSPESAIADGEPAGQ